MQKTQKPTPVAEYFGAVWNGIISTVVGLGITGKYFLTKPVTMQYPDEKPVMPDGYRGIHIYEKEKCIACDLCAAACPVDCIYIESVGKGKNAVVTRYEIDYNRCMFCGLCIEPCPANCIHMGKSFDLSRFDSLGCAIDFAKLHDESGAQSPCGDRIIWPPAPEKPAPAPKSAQDQPPA